MSQVIKSGTSLPQGAVRPLPQTVTLPLVPRMVSIEEHDTIKKRVGALEARLAERDATIQALRAEVGAAYQRGTSEGHEEGLRAAQRREDDRLAALRTGVGEAQAALANRLVSLDQLSCLLARDCLELVFANPDYRQEQIAAALATQMAAIEKAAVLEITVSADDFPDAAALDRLADQGGVAAARIAAAKDAAVGSCSMRLRLGELEIGTSQQWAVLKSALEALSGAEGGE